MIALPSSFFVIIIIWITFYVFLFPLFHLLGDVIIMFPYDNAYTVSQDISSLYKSTALALMKKIQNKVTRVIILEANRTIEFFMN